MSDKDFPFWMKRTQLTFIKANCYLKDGGDQDFWPWSVLMSWRTCGEPSHVWGALASRSFFSRSMRFVPPSIYGMGNDWKALPVSICLQSAKHRSSVGISRPCTDHLLGGLLLSGSVVVCECLLQGTLHPSWALLCGRDTSLCWIPMNTTTESARHVFPAICHSRCRDCNTSSLGGHPTPLWGL